MLINKLLFGIYLSVELTYKVSTIQNGEVLMSCESYNVDMESHLKSLPSDVTSFSDVLTSIKYSIAGFPVSCRSKFKVVPSNTERKLTPVPPRPIVTAWKIIMKD